MHQNLGVFPSKHGRARRQRRVDALLEEVVSVETDVLVECGEEEMGLWVMVDAWHGMAWHVRLETRRDESRTGPCALVEMNACVRARWPGWARGHRIIIMMAYSRLKHTSDYYSRSFFSTLPHRDDRLHRSSFPYDHSTRSSPSPPPAAPSTSPSPSYLDLASKPSKTLPEPTRKLLILDLNGTLLLRSPRPPKSGRGHYSQAHPAPRRVMPRPYLTALRAYLFAPQTRAWLDVMVWSSAQPHSVEDMVLHTLGDDRERLVAIWARDTLGLEQDHYRA